MELCPCKIIGVTGTKGKGTTASLIFAILKRKLEGQQIADNGPMNVYLAGNIGYPAISLIPQLMADDIVVLELSNFQLADFDRSPQIVVFTNLGIDHLDYHNDIDEYREAKFNILKYQTKDDYAVLNLDSTYPKEKLSNIKSEKIFFTKNITSTTDCSAGVRRSDHGLNEVVLKKNNIWEKICDEHGIKLSGRHNLENIAAASIVADILNVDLAEVRFAVKEFVGLHYRLEFIKEMDGVKFFNDSFATNPGPTMAAVDSFDENKIMILGGSSKNADFSELADKISKTNVTAIILLGVEAPRIELALKEANCGAKIFTGFSDLKQAVLQAKNIAVKGDIVIFSPACASFDMFKNYKDRGEKFNQIVDNLEDSK
jgi:UDP-N-acetylmuramoylalanine--D-glutamate ligase